MRALRTALLLPLLPLVAAAQEALPAPEVLPTVPVEEAAPAAPQDATELDVVTVTAQKRVQNLQEVPVSVGVVTGATLEQTGSFDAGSLEKYSPNIQIDNDPQAPVIGIRGFSTETDNVGFEPSVGLTFDDLALARPEFIADGFFDLERVEVLRGTQGTLFGKNTIAGVINFTSAEPEDRWLLTGTGTYGDPRQERGELAVSMPFADALAARVAGVYWKREGFVANSTLDRNEGTQEQAAARVKLTSQPLDGWDVGLSAQYSKTDVTYAPWQLAYADSDALNFARQYDAATEDDPFDFHTSEDLPGGVARQTSLIRGITSYDLGDFLGASGVAATAVAGRAAFDFDAGIDIDVSAADLIRTEFLNADKQDSLELRLAGTSPSMLSFGRDVNWVIGVFGLKADLDSALNNYAGDDLAAFAASPAGQEALGGPGGGPPTGPIGGLVPGAPIDDAVLRPYTQHTTSKALFFDLTWKLTERLAAVTGARVGQDHKEAHFNVQVIGPGVIGQIVGAEPFEATLTRDEADISPKFGLQYQWSRDLFMYAVGSKGFKGGGFNATADNDSNLQFEPERALGLEAGLKSQWLDRKLTLNTTVYRTRVENLQVVSFVGTSFKVANAAEAELQGIEMDLRWRPDIEWFSLTAAAAASRAIYPSFRNAPAAPESGDETQDLSGRTLPHAPRMTATLSPAVTLPLAGDLGAMFGVDVSYRSEQYSSGDLDSHSFEPAYTLVGARLLVGPASGTWSVIVNGSNLTDERVATLVVNNPVYANTYTCQGVAPPRTWSASLKVSF